MEMPGEADRVEPGTEQAGSQRGLRQHGYKELPSKQQRTVLRIVAEVLHEQLKNDGLLG
ncbi:MAG TPA: hypothetical protein VM571_06335 [Noviherbaspirillum sp.]|nr:hypothetical protein [Noviherbaspirillum sp.]